MNQSQLRYRFFCRMTVYLFLLLALSSSSTPAAAAAVPTISVDMDPAVAGIQSGLTVAAGTSFTVEVVIADTGNPPAPTVFDTIILEASFNDAGNVLSGAAPPNPLGWTLAGNSAATLDVFGGGASSAPGAPLGVGPSFPEPGFANGSGAVGLLDPTLFTINSALPTTIFSLDFTASTPGTSAIRAGGVPTNSPELAQAGVLVGPVTLASGTVTVTGEAVAPPSVGGTAFYFAEPSDSPGSGIATILGGFAGIFALLVAGGWFAKRRWSGKRG